MSDDDLRPHRAVDGVGDDSPAMVMATAAVAWTAAVDLLNAIRR